MNRLIDLPQEKLTPEQTEVFNRLVAGRGRILGPYKIWIHSPTVADGMEHIGTFLNKRSSLSTREVEIGILVIAPAERCRVRGDREDPGPGRNCRSAGAAGLLHVGLARHEGARGSDPTEAGLVVQF
jgi:hypothetical protein